MNPLVSIIMPTYKGTDNICIAIDAALRQTYDNIEIIVVDDNGEGTENQIETEKLLQKYIKDNKIRYIRHKKNINGSAARNTGMKVSSGKYISFLDDDDVLMPEKIEKQVRLFEQLDDGFGLVYCSGYVVKSTGVGYKLDIVEDDILYNLLSGKLRFNSSMMMIRRTVFEKTGGFDESYRRHQDWEFCCRILSQFKGKALPEHLVYKYVIDRNVPSDPEKAVELRTYFLEKNKKIIAGLGEKREKKVISFHYRDLALAYIFKKDIGHAFGWLKKAGNPIVQFMKLSCYALKRKTVHREKYAKSFDEYFSVLES